LPVAMVVAVIIVATVIIGFKVWHIFSYIKIQS